MLQVRLFGSGRASYIDLPLTSFPSQQPHLLLAYLLLYSTRSHSRDHLATLFWGEYPTDTARKYLRNSLWKLRQIFEEVGAQLDDYLWISDDSVTFIPTSPHWLDVAVFERSVEYCQDIMGQDLSAGQAARLEAAVDLYKGDLLEGTYCEWCLYERERLGLLYLRALSKMMSFHEARGNCERGLQYGERILERDNTREKVHLQMMRLYWQLGDTGAALAQYKRCAEILQDELGIPPLKETTAVYQQMLQNRYEPLRAYPTPDNAQDAHLQLMAENALHRLHQLQEMLDETRAELRSIEQLINAQLLNVD